jgi:PhzF family phenazine biosynthesis protein
VTSRACSTSCCARASLRGLSPPAVLRLAAFTDDPSGGNPAGVVLDAGGMSDEEMQAVAADVGYSESAFVVAEPSDGEFDLRYFSPLAEVPFCGHATVAAAVALGRDGEFVFNTRSGRVGISASGGSATLTSVDPHVRGLDAGDLEDLLAALRWDEAELDPELPPRVAYAGAHHPVVAAGSRDRLRALDYDSGRLKELMLAHDWTTIQLVWRERADLFHARNPFPIGGVFEDPATGAAAAALGAYLRELGLVEPPAAITVLQGEDLGRPGRLNVDVPASGGISVTGKAVRM